MEDTRSEHTTEIRAAAILRAIELGVDIDDFRFVDVTERATWEEFFREHEVRLDKDDVIWLAA